MTYKNPKLTVDLIIELEGAPKNSVVLIERKNPPHGWALPGGFVGVGETLEKAAIREAKEETDLDVVLQRQFHAYSDPKRDARAHVITIVFVAKAKGAPKAKDDAKNIKIFTKDNLPKLAFDHKDILNDYFTQKY